MRTSKTHFEQIPVATVKKIAQDLPRNNAIETDGWMLKCDGKFRLPRKVGVNWRDESNRKSTRIRWSDWSNNS